MTSRRSPVRCSAAGCKRPTDVLLLRSTVFNVLMVSSAAVYALLVLLLAPFPPLVRYRGIMLWPRLQIWLLRHLCGLDYRVEGRDNLPHRPSVILAKHQSTWETLALELIFPPLTWVLKRELMWVPLFGWALALLRPIAIARGSGRQAMEQIIQQGSARLTAGLSVLVFPEGTRTMPGRRGKYKLGGAILAAATGAPVVPVAHNAGTYWPRRSFIKRAGVIQVVIGPAIETDGRSPEEINTRAERWIESTMQRLQNGD